jgi:hypothetical protein
VGSRKRDERGVTEGESYWWWFFILSAAEVLAFALYREYGL